jgi:hypothetical protein
VRKGTVFVGEDFDEEPFMWSGRFSAHWELPDGSGYEEGAVPRGSARGDRLGLRAEFVGTGWVSHVDHLESAQVQPPDPAA